jgi:hypothetical protein
MIVDWNFSETLLAKCKEIDDLRKQGKTWYYITDYFKQSRGYLMSIYKEYNRLKGVKAS